MKSKSPSSRTLARWVRELHLYIGLFLSPFILVYAVSTLFLNHSVRTTPTDRGREVVPITVEDGLEGMPLVHSVLQQLEISGEILGRGMVRNDKTTFRVARPGTVKIVSVDLKKKEAEVVERSSGLLGAIVFLHFNPGLHKQPNWAVTKFWGWLADSVVYLTLFLTVSGIYLWWLLKAERKTGLIIIGAGGLSFILLIVPLIFI